jgi:hypothetical protein
MIHEQEIQEVKDKKEKILIKNDYLSFIRTKTNHYKINCMIENKNINIENIINFNLLELMCKCNSELFEKIDMYKESEKEAKLYLLVKPIFQSLGIYQRYISLQLEKTNINKESIIFSGIPNIEYGLLQNTCNQAILAPISRLDIKCNIINKNKFELVTFITLEDNFVFPNLLEQLIATIFKKVYKNIIRCIKCLS